ncbi:MAG: hypothetical protein U0269_14305 [Polyangiales bacterium]
MKKVLIGALALSALVGCSSGSNSGAASSSGTGAEQSSGGSSAVFTSFALGEGAVEPEAGAPRPAIAVTLAADGSVRSRVEALGKFEGNRYLLPSGAEVFHVDPDGTVAMPWRTASQRMSLRYVAAGLEVTTPDGTHVLTIDDAGVFHAGSESGGGRFTPYRAELRNTALMLRFLPMVVLMYGFAHQPAPTSTPPSDGAATPAN